MHKCRVLAQVHRQVRHVVVVVSGVPSNPGSAKCADAPTKSMMSITCPSPGRAGATANDLLELDHRANGPEDDDELEVFNVHTVESIRDVVPRSANPTRRPETVQQSLPGVAVR